MRMELIFLSQSLFQHFQCHCIQNMNEVSYFINNKYYDIIEFLFKQISNIEIQYIFLLSIYKYTIIYSIEYNILIYFYIISY